MLKRTNVYTYKHIEEEEEEAEKEEEENKEDGGLANSSERRSWKMGLQRTCPMCHHHRVSTM